MLSAIGPYEFRSLSVPGMPVERSLALVAHAGVDGHEIWDDGQRGVPFRVRSEALCVNCEQGYTLLAKYKELMAEPPVLVRWANLYAQNTKHKVLEVMLVDGGLRPIVAGFGPEGAFYALLTCDWTLLPVTAQTEEED